MPKLTIDFLEEDDQIILQLISAIQYGLSAAVEGELVSPDFETDIRAWMRVERARMRPQYSRNPQKDQLRESQWFGFWNELKPGQEVRWTQAKAATYFCVTGELVTTHPDIKYRKAYGQTQGPFVELRRHSGKTFWSHIAQVRPLDWINRA